MEHTCKGCKHLKEVMKHPWNKNDWSKGRISEKMGYVCMIFDVMDKENKVVFFDRDGVGCEDYTEK